MSWQVVHSRATGLAHLVAARVDRSYVVMMMVMAKMLMPRRCKGNLDILMTMVIATMTAMLRSSAAASYAPIMSQVLSTFIASANMASSNAIGNSRRLPWGQHPN